MGALIEMVYLIFKMNILVNLLYCSLMEQKAPIIKCCGI